MAFQPDFFDLVTWDATMLEKGSRDLGRVGNFRSFIPKGKKLTLTFSFISRWESQSQQ